jgi:hypothetical protein
MVAMVETVAAVAVDFWVGDCCSGGALVLASDRGERHSVRLERGKRVVSRSVVPWPVLRLVGS